MLKIINETIGMYKRNYSFQMDIVEKVFKVISWTSSKINVFSCYFHCLIY